MQSNSKDPLLKCAADAAEARERLQGLAAQAVHGLEVLGQAGMAVSVVKDDEIVYAGAFGQKDVEQGLPVDVHTIFPIGSATKSFTAAAILMLCERGKLDLDTPIRHYLPELQFQDDTATLLATPRDLLCHRTGLPRHDFTWVLRPYISRKELPAMIRHLAPSQPFRSAYQYSNLMYACLGRLVEVVDGRSWEDFMREELLQPLHMNTAGFTPDEAIGSNNFSLAYQRDRKSGVLEPVCYSRLGGMAPAGAIHANVLELANWSRLHLAKGTFMGKALFSEASSGQMRKPHMPVHEALFDMPEISAPSYALGWETETFRGKTLIQHGGNVSGSSALVAFMPEINAAVNVVVNTGSSMLTYATMYDVFDRLLGYGDQKDWATEMQGTLDKLYAAIDEAYGAHQDTARDQKTIRADAEFTGSYRHPAYGVVRVLAQEEGGLRLRSTQYTMPLKNLHFDVFSTRLELDYQSVPLLLTFQTGVDGSITSLAITLEAAVAPIVFSRMPGATDSKQ